MTFVVYLLFTDVLTFPSILFLFVRVSWKGGGGMWVRLSFEALCVTEITSARHLSFYFRTESNLEIDFISESVFKNTKQYQWRI